MNLHHFLLVFDHKLGKLVVPPKEFENSQEAIAAYSEKEREHQADKDLEIVLIGSDSLETVKKTHSNYFKPAAKSPYLKGLAG
jgi:hypothetical protein